MEYLRTDAMLMEILQEQKSVTGFLDTIFGFLRRNTDFYHVKKDNSEKIGFVKGVREQILFGAMQRYDPECKLNLLASQENEGSYVPPAVREVEVETGCVIGVENVENEKKEKSKLKLETIFAPGDYKNGSLFYNYCWSQTLRDVELHVKLPTEFQSAKLVNIEIKADIIRVSSRANPGAFVICGELSNKYKHNDAVWTIAEGKLLINFDKAKEVWWEKLFTSEECIDLNKVDCERYIDDLPEESQAAIHKIRAQQLEQDKKNQKDNVEYQSETMTRLRQAWDAEGSPFKGQPFDPSVVKFS